jgi:hypothetical protein
VDQLFDEAERQQVPDEQWHDFIRDAFEGDGALEGAESPPTSAAKSSKEGAAGAEGVVGSPGAATPPRRRRSSVHPVEMPVSPVAMKGGRSPRRARLSVVGGLVSPHSQMDADTLDEEAAEREEEMLKGEGEMPRPRGLLRRLFAPLESPRVLLAIVAALLLVAHRVRRLGVNIPAVHAFGRQFGPVVINGTVDAPRGRRVPDEDTSACRWDWRIGCVESSPGSLAEGAVCVLRPQVGQFLRCRPVWPYGNPLAACPSHCQARATCTDEAADMLLRLATGLRADETPELPDGNAGPATATPPAPHKVERSPPPPRARPSITRMRA